jgi:hypothetical protein
MLLRNSRYLRLSRKLISKSELGRRINKAEKEVRRILSPKHATKLPALTATLRAADAW